MTEIAVQLPAILVLGVAAHVIADHLRIPSILFLLSLGIVAGPILGFLNPDELLGDLLAPVVSLAVGLILFEGALGLRFRELEGVGRPTWTLVTLGVAITWVVATLVARYIMELPLGISVLLGSILVVSGPTVVGPLLRALRPTRPVATVLEWEGIFIDPVGAMLAVIVFEAVLLGTFENPFANVLQFLITGVVVGAVFAAIMIPGLSRFWIPDHLRSSVTLGTVVLAFTVANLFFEESGLLATPILGLILANQPWARVRDITEFSENLRVPILSILFIVLAARLDLDAMLGLGWGVVILILALMLVARPLGVMIATFRSTLSVPERIVIGAVAPRGIVAASVSSVFAIGLVAEGVEAAEVLVPATFAVIIATVSIYGLGSPLLSKWLGVTQDEPQGLLFVGADRASRTIARAVSDAGFPVVMIAGNRGDHYQARMDELDARYANVLGEHAEHLEFEEIGSALAMTPNDEFNTLTSSHLAEQFGPRHVFQVTMDLERGESVASGEEKRATPRRNTRHRGRWLFAPDLSHLELSRRVADGWTTKTTNLTEKFTWDDLVAQYGSETDPLFVINDDELYVVTPEESAPLDAGRKVIALIPPQEEQEAR